MFSVLILTKWTNVIVLLMKEKQQVSVIVFGDF